MTMRLIMLLSFVALGSSCAHVQLPDTEACAVAGKVINGATCNYTISDKPRKMTFDEFIHWLEPDIQNQRGAAICQSSNDWVKIKVALEQACYLLKRRCSLEMQQAIQKLSDRILYLSDAHVKEQADENSL